MTQIIEHQGKYFFKTENGFREIIASTDPSLNLPKPSDLFIKKYCELGSIDEAMVEYETVQTTKKEDYQYQNGNSNLKYETVLKVAPDNTITIKMIKDSWTREEVIELMRKAWNQKDGLYQIQPNRISHMHFSKWIEQNL